jgi:hypothetical protein
MNINKIRAIFCPIDPPALGVVVPFGSPVHVLHSAGVCLLSAYLLSLRSTLRYNNVESFRQS